ncbi:MAG: hypothetical protein FJ009_02905 [Chloroflexi bacterium]|nr:hypothetical protein [Chloroflexota bacterium]
MNEPTKTNGAPKTWGASSAEFYASLRDKPIQIVTLDGKIYKGMLVGVDTYDLTLRQANGAPMLLAKHAVKFIQADTPGA